jgi:broad specificity phosphatase PhoE
MSIYLIRHALPDWNCKDIPYHQPPGPPLTPQGIQEAEQLGGFLKQAGVQRLLTSPLERAIHTTQIVAEITGVSYEIQDGLIEWQPGDTEETACRRVWPVFELASQLSQEIGPVGLVTHGGPIAMLLLSLGMDAATLAAQRVYDHGNPLPTAGVWRAIPNGFFGKWALSLVFQPNH